MTIIFFHGLGSSKKLLNYIYYNEKYNENNFIKLLEKIDKVYIPEIPYTNVYYYSKYTIIKPMYNPIDKLNYNDLTLDKYIFNLYQNIDKTIYSPPYIVIGHSHGIYYASEFARQFLFNIKYVISLDGSWITKKLNKQRLLKWKNKGNIKHDISYKEISCFIFALKYVLFSSKTNIF